MIRKKLGNSREKEINNKEIVGKSVKCKIDNRKKIIRKRKSESESKKEDDTDI